MAQTQTKVSNFLLCDRVSCPNKGLMAVTVALRAGSEERLGSRNPRRFKSIMSVVFMSMFVQGICSRDKSIWSGFLTQG